MTNPESSATPAKLRPFIKYPVNVITGTSNTTINIFCDTFSPRPSREWELKASAAFVSSLPEGRTNALLIGQGHHRSVHSPNEANHLTLLPFDENEERHRADLTAHVYISNPQTPWVGEWFQKTSHKTQGPGFISRCITAIDEPLMTLDMTALGPATWSTPEFSQLQFEKAQTDSPNASRRASSPHFRHDANPDW